MSLKSHVPANRPQSSLFATEPHAEAAPPHSSDSGGNTSAGIVAFTDGGSRGNPGPSGYGVVIQAENGAILAELSEFLGIQTNNVAEYSGMLAALEYALTHGHRRLRIVSDSELMVKQMRGQYRVQSPELRPLYEEAKRRVAKLGAFQIEHVLRGKNKNADELANQAMDRGMRRPTAKGPTTPASSSAAPPVRPLRGIVKQGKISLLEGSIPEGTIVVVMPEKALGERAAKSQKN